MAEQPRGLVFTDDGEIVVPLKGKDDVTLSEPSMKELAKAHELIAAADAELPDIPIVPADPNGELIRAQREYLQAKARGEDVPRPDLEYNEAAATRYAALIAAAREVGEERARLMFGSTSPHGRAFLDVVKLLSGDESITDDHLYGWVMNARTSNELLTFFTTPLGGRASVTPTPAPRNDEAPSPDPT